MDAKKAFPKGKAIGAEDQPSMSSTVFILTGVLGLSFQSVGRMRSCPRRPCRRDLAESGVLAVQMGCVLMHDEELAAGAVGFMLRAMLMTPRTCLMGLLTPLAANSP